MRIVVLGSRGQLGRDLLARLPGEVLGWTRDELDLASPTSFTALETWKPDIVINCAAYNLVDKAESDTDDAFRVNSLGVHRIAKVCQKIGCKLIQISTDYVFGLNSPGTPLAEADAPGPVSVYGLSKLTGEYYVRMYCENHLIIRTCGLYGIWGSGGKGGNFVETMLRVAGQGKPLKVVHDQTCTPTYTADLAEAIVRLLGERGLMHATNAGSCTWYEFACEIFRQSGIPAEITPITSAQFGAPAKRPAYSVLANDRLQSLGIPMRDWQNALAAYLTERKSRNST